MSDYIDKIVKNGVEYDIHAETAKKTADGTDISEAIDELQTELNTFENNSIKAFIASHDINELTNDELDAIHNGNYMFVVTEMDNGKFIFVVFANGDDFLEFARIDSEERNIYHAWYDHYSHGWELSSYEDRHLTALYMHRITFEHTSIERGELISSDSPTAIYIVTISKEKYSGSFKAKTGTYPVVSIGVDNELAVACVSFDSANTEFSILTGLVGGYILYQGVTSIKDVVTPL